MIHAPSPSAPHASTAGAPREYLTFMLADEGYAIDILSVREIRADEPATRIAGAPEHVCGVINLRGMIVPLIDLRRYLGLGCTAAGGTTVIVVLELGERLVGMRVDALTDVIALPAADIHPAAEFSALIGARHVRGLATVDGRMLIVLDIDSLLRARELALFDRGEGR